ncbi:MAG: decaprenyl-phosphate phosphoribosyltransferase [Planctomycetota bacterium]
MLAALVEAMRPHQWVKNLLVVAPLAFAHQEPAVAGDPGGALRSSLSAFAVFCLLSSSIYLLNDCADRKADASHPVKRNRPIASGRLPVGVALAASLGLATTSLTWASQLGPDGVVPFATWPLAYMVLNLSYSFGLKRIVILDCLIIALGFQLRVHGGAVVLGVRTSAWILLCTFFFALFLAFCKRREEVERMRDGTGATRATIRDYDVPFLDQVIAPLAALSILCYALYTVDPNSVAMHGTNLKFTVPFVVFGVFRYLFLIHKRGEGADPARLLFRDPPLVLSGLLWGAAVLGAIATKGAGGT